MGFEFCYQFVAKSHLAHNVDGSDALDANDFVVIIINELFDVGFVAVGGDGGEGQVDDLAFAACGGELRFCPRGGGVVGEVYEHS